MDYNSGRFDRTRVFSRSFAISLLVIGLIIAFWLVYFKLSDEIPDAEFTDKPEVAHTTDANSGVDPVVAPSLPNEPAAEVQSEKNPSIAETESLPVDNSIRGVVVNSDDGIPIASVEIKIWNIPEPNTNISVFLSSDDPIEATRTLKDGSFKSHALPKGRRYLVRATKERITSIIRRGVMAGTFVEFRVPRASATIFGVVEQEQQIALRNNVEVAISVYSDSFFDFKWLRVGSAYEFKNVPEGSAVVLVRSSLFPVQRVQVSHYVLRRHSPSSQDLFLM